MTSQTKVLAEIRINQNRLFSVDLMTFGETIENTAILPYVQTDKTRTTLRILNDIFLRIQIVLLVYEKKPFDTPSLQIFTSCFAASAVMLVGAFAQSNSGTAHICSQMDCVFISHT